MNLYDANGMIGMYVRERVQVGNEEELIQIYNDFGIKKAVVYHADARTLNPVAGNLKLLSVRERHPLIEPCFIISPHYKYEQGWPALKKLLQEHRIRFVRIFPKEQGYSLGSVHVSEMLELADELNLNVMLSYNQIQSSDGAEDPCFDTLCRTFPNVNIILNQAEHRRNMMWYGYLEQHRNVYVEMSINNNWMTYEQTVRLFGSERLLWGSNTPFNHPGPSVSMLAYANLSQGDKENVAYKNLQLLIGGEPF